MDLSGVGKLLLVAAVLLAVLGVTFLLVGKGILPRLPGDFSFGRRNVRVFIPLGTSIVLSILLTVILNLLFRR
jgi:hypothetical protein